MSSRSTPEGAERRAEDLAQVGERLGGVDVRRVERVENTLDEPADQYRQPDHQRGEHDGDGVEPGCADGGGDIRHENLLVLIRRYRRDPRPPGS